MLENFILGIDSCRAYDRVNEARSRLMDSLYNLTTVFKANKRWIAQALAIVSDLTGLGVTFGASCFAIASKFSKQ
jgi:hypothetical protein